MKGKVQGFNGSKRRSKVGKGLVGENRKTVRPMFHVLIAFGCAAATLITLATRPNPSATTPSAGLPAGVIIPERPSRIVIANTGAADILSKLVDLKRIAAVPEQVERYASDGKFWEGHREIPRFERFQAEVILS